MIPAAAGLCTRAAAKALAATWRVEVDGAEYIQSLRRCGTPIVYVLWHGWMLPLLMQHRRESITVLVSRHHDGDHLADTAERWGYRVVRGSSTKGATAGLLKLVRVLQTGGEVALTPDGPQGPSRVFKAGALLAAHRTGAAVITAGAGASACWSTGSWDNFKIPRAFARVRIVYGRPVWPRQGWDTNRQGAIRLRERLNAVTEAARL